jgi:flagellar hook protein FlgE
VVQKPDGFTDNRPSFSGVDLYSRRGDFQLDKNGYLVNGAGYYLMGIPIDATTGNPSGSVPEILQFQNDFLPAQATTEIDYHVNLASYPLTAAHDANVPGSELLQPAYFSANPIAGAAAAAKIIGGGASLSPDAAAIATGSVDISALGSAGGTLSIDGTAITINAGDTATSIVAAINAQTGTTGVTASLDGSGHLVLTGPDADTAMTIDGASTPDLLTELGLAAGTTDPTNLLTQSAVSQGQTLTVQIGGNPLMTVTFGTGAGEVSTLAELSTAIAGLAGGAATLDPDGNLTVAAGNATDQITIGGTATAAAFGIHTLTGLPSNGTVVANDVAAFLDQSISGGSVTAYDSGGSPVNLQLRWAKVASAASGGTDIWNLFYQVDSGATGNQAAWQNAGTSYTFGANGQMNPPVSSLTLNNVVVNGDSLGNVQLVHGSGCNTQFADANGNVQVNLHQQNGFPAGSLQSIAVNDNGRVVGSYSNGRTLDLAAITLANFNGANSLKRIDGGAFEVTDASGPPIYGASGSIIGSSLEGSNTDIADEFTKLIVTQQAYSANTRVITTSNQMVQDMLNMLR